MCGVDHGDAADLVLLHQRERVAHGVLLGDGDRVVDHAVLGAFHTAHVRGLLGLIHHGDRVIRVADVALPGGIDGELLTGESVLRAIRRNNQ